MIQLTTMSLHCTLRNALMEMVTKFETIPDIFLSKQYDVMSPIKNKYIFINYRLRIYSTLTITRKG